MGRLVYRVDKTALKVVRVPEDYNECGFCGHWKPHDEFIDRFIFSRPNCAACEKLGESRLWDLLRHKQRICEDHESEIRKLTDDIAIFNQCVTKREFLKRIAEQLSDIGDDELVFPFYEGYNNDGSRRTELLGDIKVEKERRTLYLDSDREYIRVEVNPW